MMEREETTAPEKAVMARARAIHEEVAKGHGITCGEIADKLHEDFPDIASRCCVSIAYEAMRRAQAEDADAYLVNMPQPRRGGGRLGVDTNWARHFSSPERAAETLAKAKKICANEAVDCSDCPLSRSPICLADPTANGTEDSLLDWMQSKALG